MAKKLVYGFGINDLDYIKSKKENGILIWRCKIYETWMNMLQRCYSAEWSKGSEFLETPFCSEEWRYFSNFKSWMEQQNYENLHLDKDILLLGNREYSQYKCAFVPRYINNILQIKQATRGEYPLGVRRIEKGRNKQFQARVSNKNLGYFYTPTEAHRAWQLERSQSIQEVIEKYAKEDCFRTDVADALMSRVWMLLLDHSVGRETVLL